MNKDKQEMLDKDYFVTLYSSCNMTKGEAILWEPCRKLSHMLIPGKEIGHLHESILYRANRIVEENKRLALPKSELLWNESSSMIPHISIGESYLMFTPVESRFNKELLQKIEEGGTK